MLLESPRADVPARRPQAASLSFLRSPAAAGAAAMALTSTGDALLLAVLLGVAAAEVEIGVAGVLAALSVIGRWGTSSLAAMAGGQAVVGPAGSTGPFPLLASAWLAGAALVVAAPRGALFALAFGLSAAGIVAGPAFGGAVLVRAGASVLAVLAAGAAGGWLPRRVARPLAPTLAGIAALLALVRP